jgi:drug/metabolite transporter (DMT)-like permease
VGPAEPAATSTAAVEDAAGHRRCHRQRDSRSQSGNPHSEAVTVGVKLSAAVELVAARPRIAALVGATFIAFSGIFFRFSGQSPSTATLFRCALALPFLGALVLAERRRVGPSPRRDRGLAVAAGLCFAADLITWQHAVVLVGAGLATVVANFQVVVVASLSWLLFGERPDRRLIAGISLVLGGAVLIAGVLDAGAYGQDPLLGVAFALVAACAYAGYLMLIRRSNRHGQRTWGSLFDATATAAGAALVAGLIVGDLVLLPGPTALLWLLTVALTSQVAGYGLINLSLPRLPGAVTSVLLLAQPLITVVAAALLLGERPSGLQLLGVAALLVGVLVAAGPRRTAVPA